MVLGAGGVWGGQGMVPQLVGQGEMLPQFGISCCWVLTQTASEELWLLWEVG